MRKRMKRNRDKRVFASTAVTGKKINVSPGHPRGGIRL